MQAKKKSEKPMKLTLQYLINKRLPIWVRNATGDPGITKEPGFIPLQVGAGETRGRVIIPPGDDPVCITDQMDPESLRTCRDLYAAVNAGALELLDPDKAEEYYRINRERRAISKDKINRVRRNLPDVLIPPAVEQPESLIHPKVENICSQIASRKVPELNVMESFREIQKILKEADYAYIEKHGVYDKVKKWARDRLNKLNDPIEKAIK